VRHSPHDRKSNKENLFSICPTSRETGTRCRRFRYK